MFLILKIREIFNAYSSNFHYDIIKIKKELLDYEKSDLRDK